MISRFLDELGEIRGLLLRYVGVLFLLIFILLTCRFSHLNIFEFAVPVITLGSPTFATTLLSHAQQELIPEGVVLVALNPLTSFTALVQVAFIASLLLSVPYLLWSVLGYLTPALSSDEQQGLAFITIISSGLFLLGSVFAYQLLIPYTFSILYGFAPPLGVQPLFSLDLFVGAVSTLLFVTGLLFLLPVVMVTASRIGIVSRSFWKRQWRYAIASILIFTAFITPDGSGVSMLLLGLPLLLLYVIGAYVSDGKRVARRVFQGGILKEINK